MEISVSELGNNPEKYVNMVKDGDILITRDGQNVARLTMADATRMQALDKLLNLRGLLPRDTDLDAIRTERILK